MMVAAMADLRRPKHCPLVGAGDVRLTRRGFETVCMMRQSGMRMAKTQLRTGIKEDCLDCVVGDAVIQGRDYRPPGGIELIELEKAKEGVVVGKVEGKVVKVPDGHWNKIPIDVAQKIKPSGLQKYWILSPIKSGQRGVCPNCQRADMAANAYGLCATCRNVMIGKSGFELLEALAAKARDMKGKGKMMLGGKQAKERAEARAAIVVDPVVDKKEAIDDTASHSDRAMPPSPLGPMLAIAQEKLQELSAILAAKNADYGGGNPLGNFALSEAVGVDPFQGVMVRLGDKFSRSCNLARLGQAQVKDETIEDTLMDLAGYSLLAIAVRRLTGKGQGAV